MSATKVGDTTVVEERLAVLLVGLSLWSWWQIFIKMFQLRRAARDTDRFEDEFWKGGDLADLYQRTAQARTGVAPWLPAATSPPRRWPLTATRSARSV